MTKANLKVREAAKAAKVPFWRVADELGITEVTMTRKLRHELSEAEREKVLAIIDELAKEE